MNLRYVPDDEAQELRALLRAHGLEFYETEPSRWGISMGAIWLRDESRTEEARALIEQYQQQRHQRAREAYRRRIQAGTAESFLGRLIRTPVRTLVYLAIVALILYLSTKPFLDLGG